LVGKDIISLKILNKLLAKYWSNVSALYEQKLNLNALYGKGGQDGKE